MTMIPRSMDDLLEVIGEDALVRFLLSFPGMQLKVPQTIGADHPIARAIGIEAASKLARHFSHVPLYIPASAARGERDRAICDARLAGDSIEDIARRHGLTARHVRSILAKETNEGTLHATT